MQETCTKLDVKDLGVPAEMSKSGASFWDCQRPEPHQLQRGLARVCVKVLRNKKWVSPEFDNFERMAHSLKERYDSPSGTLLNKVLVGFVYSGTGYIAIEEVGLDFETQQKRADALGYTLDAVDGGHKALKFDAKPRGSRTPASRAELLSALTGLKRPLRTFQGWGELRDALVDDMSFLERFKAVDESLYIQVMSFDIKRKEKLSLDGKTDEVLEPDILGQLTGYEPPRCAFSRDGGSKATVTFVCITVLDYFLRLNTFRSLESSRKGHRWTFYGDKMLEMMDCFGHIGGGPSGSSSVPEPCLQHYNPEHTADDEEQLEIEPGFASACDEGELCCCDSPADGSGSVMSASGFANAVINGDFRKSGEGSYIKEGDHGVTICSLGEQGRPDGGAVIKESAGCDTPGQVLAISEQDPARRPSVEWQEVAVDQVMATTEAQVILDLHESCSCMAASSCSIKADHIMAAVEAHMYCPKVGRVL